MRRAGILAGVAAATVLAVVPAGTAAAPLPLGRVIAPPGAALAGYATTELEMAKGGTLDFVNLDAVSHDVTARAKGRDGKPLFRSAFTGPGVVPVTGVERLAPGVYEFFCTPHVAMRGTLTVTG